MPRRTTVHQLIRSTTAVGVAALLALLGATFCLGATEAVAANETPYQPSGTAITAGASQARSAAITAGTWRTTLPGPTEPSPQRWFRFHRTSKKSQVSFVAVTYPGARHADELKLTIRAGSALCRERIGTGGLVNDLVTVDADTSDFYEDVCTTAADLDVSVERKNLNVDSQSQQKITATIRVTEEPAVDSPTTTPSEQPSVSAPTPRLASVPVSVVGASSISGATKLKKGTYASAIATGHLQFFSVHLDWGQQLSVLLKPDALAADSDEDLTMHVSILGPTLAEADAQQSSGWVFRSDVRNASAVTQPVAYDNRFGYDLGGSGTAMAGDYLIVVDSSNVLSHQDSTIASYTMGVGVTGTVTKAPYAQTAPSTKAEAPASEAETSTSTPRWQEIAVVFSVLAAVSLLILAGTLVWLRVGAKSSR